MPWTTDIDAKYVRRCSYPDSTFRLFAPLMALLDRAGVVVRVYREHRMYPPRYDYLLRTFFRAAEPWLHVRWVSEELAEGPDEWAITVRFVANDRVYRLEMDYHSKYYWVTQAVSVVNRALEDAGAQERFSDVGDEENAWLFGTPDVVQKVSVELFLSVPMTASAVDDAVLEYVQRRLESGAA